VNPRLRPWFLVAAAAAGVAVTWTVFYPGVMSPDSLYMYREGLTHSIDGGTKTPMSKVLWMGLLTIWSHPAMLLLYQTVVFWSAAALVAAETRLGPVASAAVVLGFGLFPTVFGLLGILWSDVVLAVSLLLFVGLALTGRRRGSRAWLVASLVPLFVGYSIRVNAPPVAIPLSLWFVALWHGVDRPGAQSFRRLLLPAALMVIGLMASTALFNRVSITSGKGSFTRSLQFSFFHDLAGLAVETGDLRLPSHVYRALPAMDLATIRKAYDPANVNLLIYNGAWPPSAFLTPDPEEFKEVVAVWWRAIRAHPAAYLKRRLDSLAAVFGFIGTVYYPFHTGLDPNDMGLDFGEMPAYRPVVGALEATKGIFFRGWVFVLTAVTIVIAGIRKRRWDAAAVAASGLFYVAPYLVITTGADFRYIYWMVVATIAGLILLVFGRPPVDEGSWVRRSADGPPTSEWPDTRQSEIPPEATSVSSATCEACLVSKRVALARYAPVRNATCTEAGFRGPAPWRRDSSTSPDPLPSW